MTKLLTLFLILLTSACAHQTALPLQIKALDQLPEVSAEFETVVTVTEGQDDQEEQRYRYRYRWRFWRSENYIETQNLDDHTGEVWKKSANGQINYEQVFHAQRQVLDYFPGDLNAIGAELDWSALATLVNQSLLVNLVADEEETLLEHPVQHYQHLNSDTPQEISWLEHAQIPAMIKFSDQGHTLVTRLLAVYPLAQSPWPYKQTTDYRHTDFADVGDKENDPLIKTMVEHNRFRALAH